MTLFSAYSDTQDFINNALPGSDITALYGVNTTLSGSCSLGATSLTLTTPTGSLPTGVSSFSCWILDGANSERVDGATISGSVVTLPAPGTLAAHGAGVSVSSQGSQGCLAYQIATASAWVDTLCKQGPDGGDRTLWAISRTEKLSGPTNRASISVEQQLNLRPYRFPVASVTSVNLQMGATASLAIDTTWLELADAAHLIQIPAAAVIGTPPATTPWVGAVWPRYLPFVVTLVYTAGPIPGSTLSVVPFPIREATYLLTMHRLGFRRNPTGGAMVRLGDSTLEARLRGDTEGYSLLQKDALRLLDPYMVKG